MSAFQSSNADRVLRHPSLRPCETRPSQRAMTLIEVIGVLAILAILAAVVLPALIQQTDKVVASQEAASLQSFGNAFKSSVIRNRRIPGTAGNDWATNIAAELGLNIADVTNNIRRQPRLLLLDSTGFSTLALPYLQTDTGTLLPTNSSFTPRLMFISSLGKTLPNTLVSGGLNSSDFNNLWNWDSTQANFPTTGVWSGWTGSPYDITLQRINLSPLLVNIWLSYSGASRNSATPFYAIDYPLNPFSFVTGATNYTQGYFLQNSVLTLFYSNANSLLVVTDSLQILTHDSSFVFDQNKWLNSLGTPTNMFLTGTGGGGSGIKNFDFTDMVNGFLNAPGPTGTAANLTPSAQQSNVVQSFINYMTGYTNWAALGAPYPSALYNTSLADQAALMSNVNALISSIVVH
jgi:prepilin-type N-terminal cleavage/methylation domain-containing protein